MGLELEESLIKAERNTVALRCRSCVHIITKEWGNNKGIFFAGLKCVPKSTYSVCHIFFPHRSQKNILIFSFLLKSTIC